MKRLFGCIALALAVACGGSDSTGPGGGGAPNVVGSYTLQTVAGFSLPALYSSNLNGNKVEILNDEYTLNADHTWSEAGSLRVTNLATNIVSNVPAADNGTYTQNNTTVIFTSPVNGVATASLISSTLTVSDSGIPLVYHKN